MGLLGLDTSLFAAGDTSAAYLIWQNIQAISNTLIIIIFLAIIFSQLTGYGIDNYGIKRMLPKLIVMAILINLSFIICQLAVDLSNIVGSGIVDLSKNAASDVMNTLRENGTISGTDYLEIGFSAVFTSIFGTLAGAAAAVPIVIEAISLGAWWWIPVAIAALIGLIAVIIFFLILAARKLLAVVLVAIAPLAFACYILPNTKKLFDKWLTAFRAVLIVYPVCGGLYGISRLMKVIAFTADDVHIGMMVVALLSSFVPLVAAPIIIKNSLNAFGQLGGFIGRMGDRMKSGVRSAQGALRGTDRYKDQQRNSAIARATRNMKAYEAVRNGGGTRMQRLRYRMSGVNDAGRERAFTRDRKIVAQGRGEDIETARIAMQDRTGNYDTNIMGEQLAHFMDRIDSGERLTESEQNTVFALASQLSQQSGGAKKISEALKDRTGASALLLGGYMASNTKVRQAAENKSRRTASRISDIASGAIDANTTQAQYDAMNNQYLGYRRRQVALGEAVVDEATWRANEAAAGRTVDNTTVVENIAQSVLDKDKDFVTQSGSEVSELIQHISQDRIDRMAANTNLFSYGDVAEGVNSTVLSRASQTYVDNATGAEVRMRNIQRDNTGKVTGYEMFDGAQWIGRLGDLAGYTSKVDQARQQSSAPKVLGTRALKHNITGDVIRVRDMSDGKTIDIDTGGEIDIRNYSQ